MLGASHHVSGISCYFIPLWFTCCFFFQVCPLPRPGNAYKFFMISSVQRTCLSLGSLNNLLTHPQCSTNYISLDAFACLILLPSRLWTSLEQRLWVMGMALVRKLGWTSDGRWNEWRKTWLMANLCFYCFQDSHNTEPVFIKNEA